MEETKIHIKEYAIMVLELTKGYTPEQREYLGNKLITMEKLVGNIFELITIKSWE